MGKKGVVTGMKLYRVRDLTEDSPMSVGGVRLYTDLRWIELLEGEKKGLQFAIPVSHPEYNGRIEKAMEELEEDEYIRLSAKSVNDKGTAWICEDIERDVNPTDYI